jgi:hypothetical protein
MDEEHASVQVHGEILGDYTSAQAAETFGGTDFA